MGIIHSKPRISKGLAGCHFSGDRFAASLRFVATDVFFVDRNFLASQFDKISILIASDDGFTQLAMSPQGVLNPLMNGFEEAFFGGNPWFGIDPCLSFMLRTRHRASSKAGRRERLQILWGVASR